FLWIGGGGGTLALCAMMCFSKSTFLKQLGRLSIIPGFFNINEPLLFGLPIVLNPALAIPFVVAPVVNTFITYFAFTSGIV
ncbi:PTS transporter subunit EIIC, partial [Guyparkeria sp. 1SP6A2]|nr:PTS transporter subunit EIIC [Guyparkeria sp. 1SP6A2]